MPAKVQRQYIWKINQCETFHNDLLDAFESSPDTDYYLGPIILAEDEKAERVWVYDGQQRLTTLTIYLAAISQLTEGTIQRKTGSLASSDLEGEVRPRIDLRTRGGALTRVVRGTKQFRNNPTNMPVDWRIYEIEKQFLVRLHAVKDLEAFVRWVLRHVLLNVLWARNDSGLVLFDRANNRGIRLEWYELVKSVITEGLGADFNAQPGKKIDEFWYETERETRHQFPDLIANTAFIRYRKIDTAQALTGFEDEFSSSHDEATLSAAGKDLFGKLNAYRKTSMRLEALVQSRDSLLLEEDLIRLQLLFLEYPHWKSLLMLAEERGLSGVHKLAFLKRLRRVSYVAHLLSWPAWPSRLNAMFSKALGALEQNEPGTPNDLIVFQADQLSQARGTLSSSMPDDGFYQPLVKLWESQRAFNKGVLQGHAFFFSHVEHILPRAPRGEWILAFPNEDDRAELRNKLGNFCLLSKADNEVASNHAWSAKRSVYRDSASCFVEARELAEFDTWTSARIIDRTKHIAGGLMDLLEL